ncbi:MAG: hypothetical protein ACFCUG_02790 [Thiotrichales bacterium]
MKRNKRLTLLGSSALIVGAIFSFDSALSIGIGEVEVKSFLNQPFDAVMPVFGGAAAIPPDSLKIRLASPQTHASAGLPYPNELRNAQFRVVQAPNGRVQILANTRNPVNEPLLRFLLEVSWDTGRMVREVSVLLDPPGYQNLPFTPGTALAYNAIPLVPPTAMSDGVDLPIFVNPIPVAAPEPLLAADTRAVTERPASFKRNETPPRKIVVEDGQYGPVQPGDTLSKIAIAAYGGKTDQIKEAVQLLYKLNPDAFFNGDINHLKKGVVLRVPPRGELREAAARSVRTEPVAAPRDQASGITALPVTVDTLPEKSRLEIIPNDEAATEIARKLSAEEAEATAKAEQLASSSANLNTAATKTNTPGATPVPESLPRDAAAARTGTSVNAVDTQLSELKQTDTVILDALTKTQQDLAATRAEIERLIVSVKSLSTLQNAEPLPNHANAFDASRWLPWLLMLPLTAALIYFMRRKPEPSSTPVAGFAPGAEANPTPTPQAPPRDIYSPTMAPAIDQSSYLEPDFEAAPRPRSSYDRASLVAATTRPSTTLSGATTQAAPQAAPAVSNSDDDDFAQLFETSDLTPSASDTQETIRPSTAGIDADATQIIQHEDLPDEQIESSIDVAQEAEIYLAYQQYSLAEKTIQKLLETEPENDRFRLLQLKLFAETGRMDELQKLSVDLLQRFPDANNGTHQQIQNICERAFTKHTTNLASELGSPAAEPTHIVDLEGVAHGKSGDDFDDMTAETLYSEDISDYLSDNTLADLDGFATASMTQPLIGELSQPADVTAEELRVLSQEIMLETDGDDDDVLEVTHEGEYAFDDFADVEFLDEATDTLVSSDEEELIENYSDDDYRLAQNRLHTVESLEIPFDLENEIKRHDLDLDRRG